MKIRERDEARTLRRGRTAAGGEFRTAPAPGDAQTIRFAISGDAEGTRDPRTGKRARAGTSTATPPCVVTGTALTVTPRDQSGKLVPEETGVPCGPFTFRAG